jgi:hypothetical protein
MDLMDERTDAGTLTESDVVSYRVKTYNILNLLQAELLKQGDVFSEFSISNKPFKNELGYDSNFNVEEFIGTDKSFEANSIAKAYYFEADNEGTVYIEDYTGSWNILDTITTTNTTSKASSTDSSILGTTLTVSGTTKGIFQIGQYIVGLGITPGTRITALGTGTGSSGTYTVNISQTVSNVSITSGTLSGTTGGFLVYKGIVTPTTGATKSRIRFSGTNYYRNVNRALFNIPFASFLDVPDYRPWVEKTMPSDFKSVDQIVSEYVDLANNTNGQYAKDANYKWEGRNKLYISYYFDGNIRIIYHPIPTLLTFSGTGNSNTDLNQTLTLDDITARTILPYGLAAHLLLTENSASASFFNQRYEELKFEGTRQQAASAEQIINIYGGI